MKSLLIYFTLMLCATACVYEAQEDYAREYQKTLQSNNKAVGCTTDSDCIAKYGYSGLY